MGLRAAPARRLSHRPLPLAQVLDPDASLARGLVSAWLVPGTPGYGVGAKAWDLNRNSRNDGSFNGGVAWADGARGRALSFGPGAYVAVPDAPGLHAGPAGLTVCCWVRLASNPATFRGVLTKWADFASSAEWALYLYPNGQFNWNLSNGISFANLYASSYGVVPVNAWVFVACRVDYVAQNMSIQANGGAIDSAAYTSTLNSHSTEVRIGADQTPTSISGYVLSPLLFGRPLSDAEVLRLYQDGPSLPSLRRQAAGPWAAAQAGFQAAWAGSFSRVLCGGVV